MKAPALLLPVILAGSLSAVYLLPKVGEVAQSAIDMHLPDFSGKWKLNGQPASEAELNTLSPDTKFSKANCLAERSFEYNAFGEPLPDLIQLSVVLSGADINNSIHRPERCMPAQGHTITSSSNRTLTLPNGREFPVKRLVSIQKSPRPDSGTHEAYDKHQCLTYYFFVGHDRITNDHLGRTFIDIKDRLVRGMDQRWAYATVSMWYGDNVPWLKSKVVTEAEADAKLQKFLTDFSATQIKWDQITRRD